ncbi:hypothetical protein [Engelhardtia mirabilis]|uniref:Uncharacterized protein n=1 Tax=Engelhardtia mirabilis TaxID=2528011 RepID=A0A518BJ23_9BACT|nr:hypothetical protein Pla133_20560 [Planctomycetes bacterium Pla133]QDV01307.1 hypothetical protein Pla86_20560 [Planctomycetes bacterium Pla86]
MATATSARRTTAVDTELLYDMLLGARTADRVTLMFRDGRQITGALVFNQFKGTGRLIDVDKELSLDFGIDELRDVRF